MKSNRAKVLHTLCGVPMVNYVIEATRPLLPEGLFVVVGHQADLVEAVLPTTPRPVLQEEQLGHRGRGARGTGLHRGRGGRACSSS
jgi:bifunctional UDP-N-acetylglucosamine pyrophosphorylase/glucosamine-1-phosphate N-acetyltransferase